MCVCMCERERERKREREIIKSKMLYRVTGKRESDPTFKAETTYPQITMVHLNDSKNLVLQPVMVR